jgi:hypothetical protein
MKNGKLISHLNLNNFRQQRHIATPSTLFVFTLVGTHFTMETSFPAPDTADILPDSWALHVVKPASIGIRRAGSPQPFLVAQMPMSRIICSRP